MANGRILFLVLGMLIGVFIGMILRRRISSNQGNGLESISDENVVAAFG